MINHIRVKIKFAFKKPYNLGSFPKDSLLNWWNRGNKIKEEKNVKTGVLRPYLTVTRVGLIIFKVTLSRVFLKTVNKEMQVETLLRASRFLLPD